jgi:hypothetical protein
MRIFPAALISISEPAPELFQGKFRQISHESERVTEVTLAHLNPRASLDMYLCNQ